MSQENLVLDTMQENPTREEAYNPPLIADASDEYARVLHVRTSTLKKHIIPIYAPDRKSKPESVGSGTLLVVGGMYFLVTAAHVILKNHIDEKLTLYVYDKTELFPIQGTVRVTNDSYDVALLSLSDETRGRLEQTGFSFFVYPFSKHIAKYNDPKFMVCFAGFPTSQNKGYKQKIRPKPYSYQDTLLNDGEFRTLIESGIFKELHGVTPETHYVIHFKPSGLRMAIGEEYAVTFSDLHGMSGAALWTLTPFNFESLIGEYSPELIGIFHSGKETSKGEKYLLFTSNNILERLLIEAT